MVEARIADRGAVEVQDLERREASQMLQSVIGDLRAAEIQLTELGEPRHGLHVAVVGIGPLQPDLDDRPAFRIGLDFPAQRLDPLNGLARTAQCEERQEPKEHCRANPVAPTGPSGPHAATSLFGFSLFPSAATVSRKGLASRVNARLEGRLAAIRL